MPATSLPDAVVIHGSPGEGARVAGLLRALWPLLLLVFAAGYAVGIVARWPDCRQGPAAAGVLTLTAIALFVAATRCRRRVEAFFKGAAGEERVGHVLARLPAGYHVFHSLDAGGGLGMWRQGDLDHVVVGPAGVFVIETKNWRGNVTIDGTRILLDGRPPRRPPLEQARRGVAILRARLGRAGLIGAPLTPIVCFAGQGFAGELAACDGVPVCHVTRLLEALENETRRARTQVDVARVAAAIAA
jgi:hypothetical protein